MFTYKNVFKFYSTIKSKFDLKNIQFSTLNNQFTVKHIYNKWLEKFYLLKIDEAKESIENIIAHTLNSNKPFLTYKQLELTLTENQINKINELCDKRLKRMPIQYIIGEWQFRDLTLKLKPPIFIPRPETEGLVDIVLNHCEQLNTTDANINILELCCGSGAISLSLLQENPKISSVAIDGNLDACKLTELNAQYNKINPDRLRIMHYAISKENLLNCLNEKFHIIVSNPPYVPTEEVANLQPEILLYEDLKAIDGGLNGLEVIIIILQVSSTKLLTNGNLFLETDPRHPAQIEQFLKANTSLGLEMVNVYKDFYNKNRFVKIIRR